MLDNKTIKRTAVIITLLGILAFAYTIRRYTYWIHHWSGDQEIYIALAMKLDKFGLDGYNLRGVNVKVDSIPTPSGGAVLLIAEAIPAAQDELGYLLDIRYLYGIPHYDSPLYFMGPAFPFALLVSNHLFKPDRKFTAAAISLNYAIKQFRPSQYFNANFYAAIVPLFFSLLLITATYFLARLILPARDSLYAAFLMAVNPVDIMSSTKIWTDDMTAFFMTLTMILFLLAVKKNSAVFSVLCGLSLGAAVLTRQTSILAVMIIGLYLIIVNIGKLRKNAPAFFKTVFNPLFFIMGVVFIGMTFFWFHKVRLIYGDFLHMPDMQSAVLTDKTDWWAITRTRPHALVLFFIGLPIIWPFLAFIILAFKDCAARLKSAFRNNTNDAVVLLVSWIFIFIVYAGLMNNMVKEHRYMLPVHPALAVLAALGISKFRAFISAKLGPKQIILPEGVIIILILLTSFLWTIQLGQDTALANRSEIIVPF